MINTIMRIRDIICEKKVESSWITDLVYSRPTKVATMKLSNGRAFAIRGISRSLATMWVKSQSKGRFFHNQIKDRYNISRIK